LKHLRENGLQSVAGQKIVDVDTLDGFKFRTDAGRWVMVRPSGTEPVLRVYSEAETPEAARALVQGVVDLLDTLET
jgi:phosphomannomutase